MSAIIRKNGLYEKKWVPERRKWLIKKVKKINAYSLLREHCTIADDVTLADIFAMVESNKYLTAFISQYSSCHQIYSMHEQIKETWRNSEKEEDEIDVDYLEVYWHVGNNDYGKRKSFYVTTGLHGIVEGNTDQYSMSLTPLYEMAHLPVKLNNSIKIYKPFDFKNPKAVEIVVDSEQGFTLLEVLDAIYEDLSFYGGSDEQKQELKDELNRRVEDIKSGEEIGIPWEQIKKQLGKDDVEDGEDGENKESKYKIIFHPDVARMFGVNPDEIPLDDKHLIFDKDSTDGEKYNASEKEKTPEIEKDSP